MGRNNCFLHFCVGLVAFLLVLDEVWRIIQGFTIVGGSSATSLCFQFFTALVHLVHSSLLAYGAIQKKPKLVLAHMIITSTCLVVGAIRLVAILFAVDPKEDVGLIVRVTGTTLIIFSGLEFAVYNFYKNLKSELEEVDTHSTYKV